MRNYRPLTLTEAEMLPSTRGTPWRECETDSPAKQTCRLVTESQSRWRHRGLTLQVPRRALPKTFPHPHLLIQSHPSMWGWIQAPQRRGANQSGLRACPEHAPAGQAFGAVSSLTQVSNHLRVAEQGHCTFDKWPHPGLQVYRGRGSVLARVLHLHAAAQESMVA